MKNLALVLSLCTVAAVGVVYFFTDNFLLSGLILVFGLVIAFVLDKKLAVSEAPEQLKAIDDANRKKTLQDLEILGQYRIRVMREQPGNVADALCNIYDVSNYVLYEGDIDPKFVNQISLYLPRINKVLDTYLKKNSDADFKSQAQTFISESSDAFSKLLTATGNKDMSEAESLMQALEETYAMHGHLKRNDKGDIS